jgi:hypothetical protein
MSKINAIHRIGSNYKIHIFKNPNLFLRFENDFFCINLFSKIDRSLHQKLLISLLNKAKQMVKKIKKVKIGV